MIDQRLLVKIKFFFAQQTVRIRFLVLLCGWGIVFGLWSNCLTPKSPPLKQLVNYREMNKRLSGRLVDQEKKLAEQQLVKIENVSGQVNSLESVLKRLNLMVQRIDYADVLNLEVRDQPGEAKEISEVKMEMRGSFFSLVGFVSAIMQEQLPVELNLVKCKIERYPLAKIELGFKIKEELR